ncbi:MAG: DUF3352 domain-containing protein [Cyanobacteria bacterium P01_C01_bin.120]
MSRMTGRVWLPLIPAISVILPAIAALPSVASTHPAELLPADTALAIAVDMRSETWDQLTQYALFQQLQAQGDITLHPGSLAFLPSELTYEDFIAPWVGDTAVIALLPLENPAESVIQEQEILIAPIADPAAFAAVYDADMVGLLSTIKEAAPNVEQYQDIEIVYWEPLFLEAPSEATAPPEVTAPEPTESAPAPLLNNFAPQTTTAAVETATETDQSVDSELPIAIPDKPGLAIALFPDFMVVAESPVAIRTWADLRPAPTDSLANTSNFQRTLAHPSYDQALGALYGNVSELLKYYLTDLSLPELPFDIPWPTDIPPQELAQLTSLQIDSNIEALIYPQPQGLRLHGRGYYNDLLLSALVDAPSPVSSELLAYAPKDSYFMINSQNIAAAWQDVVTTLEATEETQAFLDMARGFTMGFAGLDLDEDIFGWMDRGFSLFLYPTNDTPLTAIFPRLRIGLGIALQTSDRPTAEATFDSLDVLMDSFLVAVEPSTVEGQPATSWGEPLGNGTPLESFLGRTWISDDTLLLTTSIEALSGLAQMEPAQAMSNSFRFVESTRDFPTANQGYLFANTAPMRSLFNSIFPPIPGDPEALQFSTAIASVQAFSGTVSFAEEYAQVDGFILLSPAENP